MDALSILLLSLVILWIGAALRHTIRNKGGCSCGCGGSGKTKKTNCSGSCGSCSGCHK